MKLSYAVVCSDIESEFLPAYRGELGDVFKRLVSLDYQGTELMIKNPKKLNRRKISGLCSENGLEVALICTGEVYGEDGLALIASDKQVRKKAFQRMKEIIEFAAHFQAGVNIGRVRGSFCKEVDKKESLEWAVSAFSELAFFAEGFNVCLLLEPINRFQCNFINTTREGIDMVKQINSGHFRLMLDLFHMNIEDASIESGILEAGDYLRHIHICDSNRHAPGCGHLNFPGIINTLKKIDYQNFLSGEVLPVPDDYTAAQLTAEYLRPLLSFPGSPSKSPGRD